MTKLDDRTDLIRSAQQGDDGAMEALVREIRTKHLRQQTWRYVGRNVLVSDAEIESEFLLGCFQAIGRAKLDLGNPLSYVLWKGQMAVVSLMRKRIKQEVKYRCLECGSDGTIALVNRRPVCPSCRSEDLYTWMGEIDMTAALADDERELAFSDDAIADASEIAWQLATFGIQIEELRSRLDGDVLRLFDLVVMEGFDRESSKSYINEIASRMGCSSSWVRILLDRLRSSALAYLETC